MADGVQETKIAPNQPFARDDGENCSPRPCSGMKEGAIATDENLEENITVVLSEGSETSSNGANEGSSGEKKRFRGGSADLITLDDPEGRLDVPPCKWIRTRRARSAELVFGGVEPMNSKVWRVLCDDETAVAVKLLDKAEIRKSFTDVGLDCAKREMERLWALRDCPYIVDAAELPDGLEELEEFAGVNFNEGTFVCTEWCNGKSLEEVAGADISSIIKWWKQLCIGVSAIHALGVLHNDLVPRNIFLHNGDIRIADLGNCTPLGDADARWVVVPFSMFACGMDPPLRGTEVFSVGMLVLHLLSDGDVIHPQKHLTRYILESHFPRTALLPSKHQELLAQMLEVDSRKRPTLEDIFIF